MAGQSLSAFGMAYFMRAWYGIVGGEHVRARKGSLVHSLHIGVFTLCWGVYFVWGENLSWGVLLYVGVFTSA